MGAEELGPWEPLTVAAAVELFQPATFRWWLAGGHALEAPWCRPSPDAAWALDILIGGGDDHEWAHKGVPYLAPEIQLLFKNRSGRPKDEIDAATAIPVLTPERRTWLAQHLPAEHAWQTTIAAHRARLALEAATERSATVRLLASGRSSQAWRTVDREQEWVIRVPIPNSGRLISYRSEVLIGELLADAAHPVSRWHLERVDDVECSIGTILEGSPMAYDSDWRASFTAAFASVLRDLHRLPATGWGPLADSSDELRGSSESANDGIVDRWFHAAIWPFDGTDLATHPIAALDPDLAPGIAAQRDAIVAAAAEPFGVVHSDLHNQHLLHVGGELAGVLDFGDAFIGSTAWDFALIAWYYGAGNAQRVARAYGTDSELAERGALLAIAVGCYKVAKTPHDPAASHRLRSLLAA